MKPRKESMLTIYLGYIGIAHTHYSCHLLNGSNCRCPWVWCYHQALGSWCLQLAPPAFCICLLTLVSNKGFGQFSFSRKMIFGNDCILLVMLLPKPPSPASQ